MMYRIFNADDRCVMIFITYICVCVSVCVRAGVGMCACWCLHVCVKTYAILRILKSNKIVTSCSQLNITYIQFLAGQNLEKTCWRVIFAKNELTLSDILVT